MNELKVYPKHPNLLSVSTLSKNKVINSREEDLGKIEDFVIDTAAGGVAYAILSFGGFMGVGDKLFAIPWNAMDLNTDRHAFVFDVDKDRLKNAPSFERGSWPDITSWDWGRNVYGYYGLQPYWSTQSTVGGERPLYEGSAGMGVSATSVSTASAAAASRTGSPEVYSAAPSPSAAAAPMHMEKASDLKGNKVRNREGEHLGKIEEIMIELDSGRIGYAVLSFGGILGIGDKLFAVPWRALSIDRERRESILDVPKKRLEEAPGFDKDNWPDMADPKWGEMVHGFYGQTYAGG